MLLLVWKIGLFQDLELGGVLEEAREKDKVCWFKGSFKDWSTWSQFRIFYWFISGLHVIFVYNILREIASVILNVKHHGLNMGTSWLYI